MIVEIKNKSFLGCCSWKGRIGEEEEEDKGVSEMWCLWDVGSKEPKGSTVKKLVPATGKTVLEAIVTAIAMTRVLQYSEIFVNY